MDWHIVGKCALFALFFGVATWVRARKRDRTATQTGKMWLDAWVSAGFFSAGVLLATGILIKDSVPQTTMHLVDGLAFGAIVVAFFGGAIHGLIARRVRRLGLNADYGDLDDLPPPEESLRR